MDRVLITGISGFIGSAFISYVNSNNLLSNKEIVVLSTKLHKNFETILYNPESFIIPKIMGVSAVIHIGSYTPKSKDESNDIDKCSSNIIFTRNLLDSLPKTIRKFVLISTVDIYKSTNQITNEKSIVSPGSIYGWSKLFCEKIIIEWCKQQNVSFIVLRLGHIYGSGEDEYKKLIPVTIKSIIKGQSPIVYTNGLEKRSFLHVNDCVRCIWEAYKSDCDLGVVNIVSGISKTVLEIVNLLIEISGKKLCAEILNNYVETRDTIFDNKLMVQVFGAEQISLEDGLIEEYEYFVSK